MNTHVLHQLVDALPQSGKWTQDKRSRWLAAVEACVDTVVEVEALDD